MYRLAMFLLLLITFSPAYADEVAIKDQGITLNARLDMGEGSSSVKDGVILMVHGTFAHNDMEIMRSLSDLLNAAGYNTLAINLSLGVDNRHGFLDCGVTHKHKHTDALGEIGLWVDWLKKQGVTKIVLMGHSRGGNQVAWYAMDNPDPVIEKVVLVAPATWDWDYELKDYKNRYGKSLEEVYASAQELVARGNGEAVMRPVGFVYCKDAAATAESIVDYYENRPERNTPDIVGKITAPVMVFAGSEDDVVKGLIPQMEKQVEAGKVDLEVIDGSDHFFRDLYAEDLVDIMTDYLGWEQ